jgi:hypothetical protein
MELSQMTQMPHTHQLLDKMERDKIDAVQRNRHVFKDVMVTEMVYIKPPTKLAADMQRRKAMRKEEVSRIIGKNKEASLIKKSTSEYDRAGGSIIEQSAKHVSRGDKHLMQQSPEVENKDQDRMLVELSHAFGLSLPRQMIDQAGTKDGGWIGILSESERKNVEAQFRTELMLETSSTLLDIDARTLVSTKTSDFFNEEINSVRAMSQRRVELAKHLLVGKMKEHALNEVYLRHQHTSRRLLRERAQATLAMCEMQLANNELLDTDLGVVSQALLAAGAGAISTHDIKRTLETLVSQGTQTTLSTLLRALEVVFARILRLALSVSLSLSAPVCPSLSPSLLNHFLLTCMFSMLHDLAGCFPTQQRAQTQQQKGRSKRLQARTHLSISTQGTSFEKEEDKAYVRRRLAILVRRASKFVQVDLWVVSCGAA